MMKKDAVSAASRSMSAASRKSVWLILALQFVAFWAVWRWYAVRLMNSPEEAWGLLALATVVALIAFARPHKKASGKNALGDVETDREKADEARRVKRALSVATLCVVVYALSFGFVLPLVRAGVAMVSLAFTLLLLMPLRGRAAGGCTAGGRAVGVTGLLLLALPLIPSLQFYAGYPLRIVVAGAAALMLRAGGFAVVARGTCLDWGGQLVWVDAPCSGVRMLWTGLYLTLTLTLLFGLRAGRTLFALFAACAIVIVGNIFRAVALFYVEAGIVDAPAWAHAATGVATFLIVAALITLIIGRLQREDAWRELFST